MRKFVIVLGSIIIIISLVLTVKSAYNFSNQGEPGIGDKTASINVNVMRTRTADWKKIIDEPIISKEDMRIIDGSTATIPITAEIFRQFWNYSDKQLNSEKAVIHSTTHNAYLNLINYRTQGSDSINNPGSGKNDSGSFPVSLIFVTPPSDEEKQTAKDVGVVLDITPIAKDGFVFITNKDNPVDNLTVEQVQDIYTGKITNWNQVGGKDLLINAYQREVNSGSQTAMEQLVMKGKEMIKPIDTKISKGMGPLVDAVAEYQNGESSIGYTYYYYINNIYRNENIKVLKINGISSENKNLLDNSYPFTTSYYAVMRSTEAKDSPARKLRDFLITEKGQQLIAMAGYCGSVISNG
jgi:phosphate transport system substrate-binding protein